MTERDNLITEKLNNLVEKKNTITAELEALPKYKTNLMVNGKSMRAVSSVKDLYEFFEILYTKHRAYEEFEAFFWNKTKVESSKDHKIFGYTFDEWKDDLTQLVNEIDLKNTLASVNDSITKLDRFYSQDKRDADNFNKLLGTINELI